MTITANSKLLKLTASLVLASWASSATAQMATFGDGQFVNITVADCMEALEKGNILPNGLRPESRDIATAVYQGKFFILGRDPELVCFAVTAVDKK